MATDVSKQYNSFPSDLAPLEQKKTNAYGLQYAQAMYAQYLINYPITSPQYLQYFINREFALGTYSTDIYKQRLGLDGDTSYLNLDMASVNRIPTILQNMIGKMINKPYRFQCNPLDTISRSKYDAKRAEIKADMFLKKQSAQAEQVTGMPLVPNGKTVPENDEEAELHMQMNFKLDEAAAMELALKWVFDNNNFDSESLPLLYRDIFTDNKTAIFRYLDANRNIRVKRYDHLKIILPYSQYEDFHDATYQGILNTYTIGEIAKLNPKFTDEQLYTIAKNYSGQLQNSPWNTANWFDNYARYNQQYGAIAYRQFQNFTINVVNFYFLSPIHDVKAVKTSVSGKVRVEDKKEGYVPVKEKEKTFGEETVDIETVQTRKTIRFEGFWIPQTDYVWNYQRTENEDRDNVAGAYSPETELPAKVIMPNQLGLRNKSKVEMMIPFEKQLNLAWEKLQQFMIEAMPPGVMVNQNALLELIDGQGEGKALPTDWTKLYKQTGNIVYSDTDADGRVIQGKPIEQLQGGMSTAFQQFMTVMEYCMGKMNDVIGYNTAVDGSSPKSDALVGVNEMAQQATYDVLRPDYMYVMHLIEGSAKRVALMIQHGLRFENKAFRSALEDAIGKANVDVLIEGREFPFSSAAISIEPQPDEKEMSDLNALIQLGVQNQTLTPSDVLRVRQQMKTNVKLAGQLLVYLENKNAKQKQDYATANIQQTAASQQQSAQITSQLQAQLDEVLTNNKIKLINAQLNADLQIKNVDLHNGLQIQQLKNEGLATQSEINSGGKVNVQHAANEGKIVTQQIADATKIEREKIIHDSKIKHTAFQSVLDKEAEKTEKAEAE